MAMRNECKVTTGSDRTVISPVPARPSAPARPAPAAATTTLRKAVSADQLEVASGRNAVLSTTATGATVHKLPATLTRSLDQWLKNRRAWNHQDWTDLLHRLHQEGHGKLTGSQEGRDCIGLYLEGHRGA